MLISADAEKEFDKIRHIFRIKILENAGLEGIYLNIIKVIYEKPTVSTILTGGKNIYK